MARELDGRVALVTGSTDGIGVSTGSSTATQSCSPGASRSRARKAQRRIAASNMPSGREVAPEQVAALVAFLCSVAAAENRGAAFPFDGAWPAR